MEIQSINLAAMKNSAHLAFNEATIVCMKELSEEARKLINARIVGYMRAFTTEDQMYKTSQKSLLTDELMQADQERDHIIRALATRVDGWYKISVEEFHKPAAILKQSLKDYNINPSMQMDQETGEIMHLLKVWEAQHSEQVQKLGVAPFLAKLKVYNNKVQTIIAERTNESVLRAANDLKAARLATDEAYKSVIAQVNAYLVLEETDLLDDFAEYMNTHIKRYKEQAMRF